MSAVPLKEVVGALQNASSATIHIYYRQQLAKRIKQHGIAPPDGMVVVAEVVRNDAGQIRIGDAKGDSFDMSKFIGVKLYAAPEVLE